MTLSAQAHRLYRQLTSLHQPIRFGWSDTAMTAGSTHGTLVVPWADLHNWSETDGAIVVRPCEAQGYILPRRALGDEQRADLIATIEASPLARF